jgi:hypothetical protein
LGREALEVVERHVGVRRLRHLLEESREERIQKVGVDRVRRQRVEVGERRARVGEAQPLEQAERLPVVGRGGEEVGHSCVGSSMNPPPHLLSPRLTARGERFGSNCDPLPGEREFY